MSDVTFEALGHACADAWKAGYENAQKEAVNKVQHLLDTAHLIDSPAVVVDTLEIALKEVKNV